MVRTRVQLSTGTARRGPNRLTTATSRRANADLRRRRAIAVTTIVVILAAAAAAMESAWNRYHPEPYHTSILTGPGMSVRWDDHPHQLM